MTLKSLDLRILITPKPQNPKTPKLHDDDEWHQGDENFEEEEEVEEEQGGKEGEC